MIQEYIQTFINGYSGFANHLWGQIVNPSLDNYFYWLILVSLFFLGLEWFRPWRKDQPKFRQDFWLDAFYMFFNFFLFWLIIYNAVSDVVVKLFNNIILSITSVDLQALNPMRTWPLWAILLVGFVMRDFVQWWTHRLLHKSDFLWEFHKVHHSVKEMGFAAHLRYHWMETVVYRTIEYIPLALMGIGLHDFFMIHIFTLAVGHYNHANISVSGRVTGGILGLGIGTIIAFGYFDVNVLSNPTGIAQLGTVLSAILIGSFILGPVMKKIFNHPEMHIWHHAYNLPEERRTGINFGLTLAIWDFIFGTAYMPTDGRDIRLGFPGVEQFPETFTTQVTHGFKK